MSKNSFLIVGNSVNQTRSLVKYLKFNFPSANIQELYTETNLKNFTKKNISNVGFLFLTLRVMCFAEKSWLGYSFWHNVFQQKKSRSNLLNLTFLLIAYGARKYTYFSYKIRSIIESLFKYTIINKERFEYDAVFFTGILSTKIEMNTYFLSLKNNIKTIYWPYNWDNPFGKMYLPTMKFDLALSWGSQMTEWMKKIDSFKSIKELPHPRLSYLLDVYKSRKKNKKNIVLIALSQKPGSNFFFIIDEINKIYLKKNIGIKFIVRPHPYEPLNINTIKKFMHTDINIEIDNVYIEALKTYGKNCIPASFESIQNKLDKSLSVVLKSSMLVITEAGTLTAEALAIDIPVICMMNNFLNKTMRTTVHATHFSSITNNKNLLMVFSHENIENKLRDFLRNVNIYDQRKIYLFNRIPDIINLSNLNKKINFYEQ